MGARVDEPGAADGPVPPTVLRSSTSLQSVVMRPTQRPICFRSRCRVLLRGTQAMSFDDCKKYREEAMPCSGVRRSCIMKPMVAE